MEVKKIVEGMTAPEVANIINGSFEILNTEKANKEETDAKLSELGSKVVSGGIFESSGILTFDATYLRLKLGITIPKGSTIVINGDVGYFHARTNENDETYQVIRNGYIADIDINYINNTSTLGSVEIGYSILGLSEIEQIIKQIENDTLNCQNRLEQAEKQVESISSNIALTFTLEGKGVSISSKRIEGLIAGAKYNVILENPSFGTPELASGNKILFVNSVNDEGNVSSIISVYTGGEVQNSYSFIMPDDNTSSVNIGVRCVVGESVNISLHENIAEKSIEEVKSNLLDVKSSVSYTVEGKDDATTYIYAKVNVGDKYKILVSNPNFTANNIQGFQNKFGYGYAPSYGGLRTMEMQVPITDAIKDEYTTTATDEYLVVFLRADIGQTVDIVLSKTENIENHVKSLGVKLDDTIDNAFTDTVVEDVFSYEERYYTILDNGKYGSSVDYRHVLIPLTDKRVVRITGNNNSANGYIAWMKSNAEPVAGGIAEFVDGTDRILIEPKSQHIYIAPKEAKYLYVSLGKAYEGYLSAPSYLALSGMDVSGVNVSKKEVSISLDIEMGGLYNGATYFASNVAERMLQRCRTSSYINISEEDSINSIIGVEDETFKINCYNSKFEYIGSTSTLAVLSGTSYIKIAFRSTAPFSKIKTYVLNVVTAHPIYTYKNSETLLERKDISFKIELPVQDSIYSADFVGHNGDLVWDNGYIYLPYNYKRDGNSVPLIIFMHGTAGFSFVNSTSKYKDYLSLFLHNGYAVADCSCKSSYYGTDFYGHYYGDTEDSKLSPLVLSCYKGLYDYIVKNYNIRTDGVYLCSKSAGGLVSTFMSYQSPFPVRCVSNLAPALSMCGNSWRVTSEASMNFWLKRFYMDTDNHHVSENLEGDGDLDFVLNHIDNVVGYDPLFKNSDLPFADVVALMYSLEKSSESGSDNHRLVLAYMANEQFMNYINNAKKYQPIPVKTWIAADDTDVPIEAVRWIEGMVKRGNGIWCVRELPSGTGGHHAVDNDPKAIQVDYKCLDGFILTSPIAYAETLEWFNRW